jgi:adenylate kinase
VDIVLLGAPGAGKGTQGALLSEWLGLPWLSTGDLFRAAIEARTELGKRAKGYIDRGELVPDAVTIAMMAERVAQTDCACGVIMDGFPRTVAQAESLAKVLSALGRRVDAAAYIKVSQQVALQRLVGRWTCRGCGAVYHRIYSPERVRGVCDICEAKLYQREDDLPETQSHRIEVYLEQTPPLTEYYRARGVLLEVDGEQDVDAVQRALRQAIGAIAPESLE